MIVIFVVAETFLVVIFQFKKFEMHHHYSTPFTLYSDIMNKVSFSNEHLNV